MKSKDSSKIIRKKIRELSALAHEKEMENLLFSLSEKFDRWKKGEIKAFDLSVEIHKFHDKDAREIYNRYNAPIESINVARAIVTGLLDQSSIPPDVLQALEKEIAFCKEN